jgi:hypothetical protein
MCEERGRTALSDVRHLRVPGAADVWVGRFADDETRSLVYGIRSPHRIAPEGLYDLVTMEYLDEASEARTSDESHLERKRKIQLCAMQRVSPIMRSRLRHP